MSAPLPSQDQKLQGHRVSIQHRACQSRPSRVGTRCACCNSQGLHGGQACACVVCNKCRACWDPLTVGHKGEGQALEGLIPADEVVVDGVDGQPQELVLLQSVWAVTSAQREATSTSTAHKHSPRKDISLSTSSMVGPMPGLTSFIRMEQAMYPTCFSEYLHSVRRSQLKQCSSLRTQAVYPTTAAAAAMEVQATCRCRRTTYLDAGMRSQACLCPNSTS